MRRLQDISISTRLRILFGGVIVLMLLGSTLSFWQFRNVTSYGARLSGLERRVSSLLRLNNRLLDLMARLYRAAEQRDAHEFETSAWRLLDAFQWDSAEAMATLRGIASESDRDAALMSGVQSMVTSLPERVESMVQLARAEDWVALNARLLNQADQTDDVVAVLIGQVDADMASARTRLVESLDTAQSRAFNTLLFTALLSIGAAVLLGTFITRSITHPLTLLDRAARALAAGEFHHRVPVRGSDELAHVGEVFNTTAAELAGMFEEVQRQRTTAQAAEAALHDRAQELARANADLQQFAYSASHDLQEPLRIVALYSQLLKRKYTGQLDENADFYIGHLFRAARQMEQLISDLLAYTQTASINKDGDQVADMGVVLQRVLALLELQIRSEKCILHAEALPRVQAHEIHVQQLLQNLIGNALKYRSSSDPEIRIWAEREAESGHWIIAVRDNGIGIDPQYAVRIFGIFKRLHGHTYPGTGIGLAICQRIVERYGGRIWVESQPGHGATFRFTLPAA